MDRRVPVVMCLAAWWVGAAAMAQAAAISPSDVRLWAASCAACHGPHGKAEGAGMYLAGVSYDKLYKRLLEFKQGTRHATIMHQHAKGYSDPELQALAEHFSKIK